MKILIASIGRGKYDKASGTYRYESCKYRYGSTDAESAYIPFALQTFQRYDKLILLGTAGSGWVNFYEYSDFENNLKFRAAFNQAFIPKNTAPDALDFRDACKELYKIRNRFAHPSGDGISSSDRDAMKRLIIRTEKDYRAMQEKPEQLDIFAEAVRKNLPENEDL